jgi:arsenite methyltransferase
VVVQRELTLTARETPDLWAACVAGALPEPELLALLAETGFIHVGIVARHDCFRGTSAERKVSRDLRVGAVTLFAEKA